MTSQNKSVWGEPRAWVQAVGGLVAIIGLLRLISGLWTPDAAASAGSGNATASIITLVIGAVIVAASFAIRRRA